MNGYLARITPWWRDRILEAGLPDGFARDLNALATIRSHENEATGLACPSVDRLAISVGHWQANGLRSRPEPHRT